MSTVGPPAGPVQVAVRQVLLADQDLMAMITGVWDHVPATATHPYVTYGSAVDVPDDTHDRRGWASTFTLEIWSRYRGTAQALTIRSHLDRLLHRQPLIVAGFVDVSIVFDWSTTLRDPDPDIRHVPVRYRASLTEE